MSTETTLSGYMPSTDVPPEFQQLFVAEDRHFWFRSRNQILAAIFQDLTDSLPKGYRVLEVGCGDGNVLRVLEAVCREGHVTGLELHGAGLDYARQRTSQCTLLAGDVNDWPFADPFQIVGMFDVLEHIEDDEKVLRVLHRGLAPEGRLVLTVPAHMELWSHTDVYAQHFRRYEQNQLTELLSACGYEIEYVTQFMLSLYPVMWLSRRVRAFLGRLLRSKPPTPRELFLKELRIVPFINGIFNWLLQAELPFIKRRQSLPFGCSLLAVARKVGG